ncbi:MAG: hypothetical protein ABSC11_10365 [Smithella sp.]|jgi:glycine cleavage system pyridoxal-binding protein P
MNSKKITLNETESFIKDKLPKKIERDLQHLKMVKEPDLEGCIYYHLRSFLKGDDNWRVFLGRYSYQTGHYIDILIFQKKIPRIAIELKWNKKKISLKDRKSLNKSLKKLRVNKAYFISTLTVKKPYEKISKKILEKNRLIEISVPLNLKNDQFTRWRKERELYRSKMNLGKKAIINK